MGRGIMDCRIPTGDDAFIYATLDKTADAINLDINRLIEGISETQQPCSLFDGLLLLHSPCGLLRGSDSPEADEVLLRQY
jgi:hypothetical protein